MGAQTWSHVVDIVACKVTRATSEKAATSTLLERGFLSQVVALSVAERLLNSDLLWIFMC